MSIYIVLLRAIGPVTHKVMSMQQWRDAVAAAGYDDPQTYVATGNMVVGGSGSLDEVTRKMDDIVRELGLASNSKAIVRTPRQLQTVLKADPFPEASAKRPGAVAVYFFAKAKPSFDWVKDYDGPEQVRIVGQHLVVDYDTRITGSRLPGIIEKKSGTATARNWNTLRGLVEKAATRLK
jgi:uncharacterized protein (DUF1697 family)